MHPQDNKSFDIKPSQETHQPHTPTVPNGQSTHGQATNTPSFKPVSKKSKKRDEIKSTLFTVLLFILAPVMAVLMIVFVFQSYVVDGSSMEPTLQNGNRVFILKLPKTIASLQDKQYIPARNEVIVFKKPTNDGTQLIKRVIGLPGDTVVIENGVVRVYNFENPNGFDPDAGTDYEGTLEPVDTGGRVVTEDVGEGELFVLGDNRGPGGSLDSHSGLGLVPVENVVGRLWLRYYPFSEFQTFAKLALQVVY